jgi:hypothetical protein
LSEWFPCVAVVRERVTSLGTLKLFNIIFFCVLLYLPLSDTSSFPMLSFCITSSFSFTYFVICFLLTSFAPSLISFLLSLSHSSIYLQFSFTSCHYLSSISYIFSSFYIISILLFYYCKEIASEMDGPP